ncbi:MAG: hypothetical protein JY451_02355 [Erythrobacter sp.]|nr:MAG: hypothetical protein JY451_02355 [Erythrobacter sp.]
MTEMQTDTAQADRNRRWKKAALALGLGAIAGFAGATLILQFFDSGALPAVGASVEIAALVGLIYMLTAAAVAVGVISPKSGAKFLNVEDAEELQEQRGILLYSGIGMATAGLALVAVALGGVAGVIDPAMALTVYIALSVMTCWISLKSWKLQDELMRAAGSETAAFAYYLVLGIGGTWAVLAHLGFVTAPQPLDWLTLFWGLTLLAAFIAAGRRGMLAMR